MVQSQPTSGSWKPGETNRGYPKPIIVPPSAMHTHSIIMLHGRGSNAPLFSVQFISSKVSSGQTIKDAFPSVKWIFPTASKRRAVVFNRTLISQWFDLYSLEDIELRKELQYDGLRESSAFLHNIIDKEAAEIGLGNVVIGGLSQGCAIGLQAVLNYQPTAVEDLNKTEERRTPSLGGFFGMSGWLPFVADMVSEVLTRSSRMQDDESNFVSFDNVSDDETNTSMDDSPRGRQCRVANLARDLADLNPLKFAPDEIPSFSHVPFFLGHGTVDEKVNVRLGEQARDMLVQLGLDVTWKVYEDFGHWWKEPDEIDDVVGFLEEKVGLGPRKPMKEKRAVEQEEIDWLSDEE